VNTFDPWPIIGALLPRQLGPLNLTPLQRLQVEFAYNLRARQPRIVTGYDVLQAASECAGAGVPMPDWLAREFCSRVHAVASFATGSLDSVEAFGPSPTKPKGAKQLRSAHLRYRVGSLLKMLFGPPFNFPRTDEGFTEAAKVLGITRKQAQSMLPKTRKNVRGHKPYKSLASSPAAHDPFALAGRKSPKR
jgi:hypothetical protein